jgi:DNA-binding response OmpR family regulator
VPVKEKVRVGELLLDEFQHELRFRNEPLTLTPIEFRLISLLMKRGGLPLERQELLEAVWGYGKSVATRTVDTHVMRVRGKLGDAAELIETVRGYGYRLRGTRESVPEKANGLRREERLLTV